MRPFRVFKRENGIYYARSIDVVSGSVLCTRSTGTRDKFHALMVVSKWVDNGIPCTYQNRNDRKKGIVGVKAEQNKRTVQIVMPSVDTMADEQAIKLLIELQKRYGLVTAQEQTSVQTQVIPQSLPTPPQVKLKKDIGSIKLVDYLLDFWNYETSKYIREKKARGFTVGKRHCYEMQNRVKNYWTSHFGDTVIGDVDSEALSDFFLDLRETLNLSGSTINNVMNAGNVAFKWAFEHKQLAENLAEGVMRFAVNSRERGILTEIEATQLFKNEWKDNRAKIANLLAMTTGMRAGEILALRPCDVQDTYIEVAHSWNEKDGIKCPKNGKARKVPLISGMRSMLLQLAQSNPHGISTTNFIFYSTLSNQPVVLGVISDNLALELRNIGIDEEMRQERNIVFHSWRHYYAVQITQRVELAQAQQALGHLTPDMTKHYANHKTIENLQVIEKAVNEAFSNVVPFLKRA